uniref:Protein kinase domain-containing protein n=1 Tax=Opuntia streptacantha TaxID=393608 RepID=A0A7C9EFQ5_OPUST
MKCLYYFKDKARSTRQTSAPELRNPSTACDHSAAGSAHAHSAGSTNSPRAITDLYQDKDPNFRVFTFSELRMATNDFNRPLKIGEGGFGSVDKGEINPREFDAQHHPIFVAVKKLKQDGFQGNKQWLAEVQFLGVVEHWSTPILSNS